MSSDVESLLIRYWKEPVSKLAAQPRIKEELLTPEMKERHRIFSLTLMAIVHANWNGNKRGKNGTYSDKFRKPLPNGRFKGVDDKYLGHNIAAIAVDGNGKIIDFDFNHNDIFESMAEHAEARLVRRLFSLTQIYDAWETRGDVPADRKKKQVDLSKVTIYTSLESCSQCAGVMTLGMVGQVVYLQTDPGMYCIGNILRNLTVDAEFKSHGVPAPLPISADKIDFRYFGLLNSRYLEFQGMVGERAEGKEPFFTWPDRKEDATPSVTSFLCTDTAYDAYEQAAQELDALTPKSLESCQNEAVLKEAKDFVNYVKHYGGRGTPHK